MCNSSFDAGADPGGGGQGCLAPPPPILNNPGIDLTFIVASEKNPGIHFYSGFREKRHTGVQFEILKKSRYGLL